jgi:hypothetical protein
MAIERGWTLGNPLTPRALKEQILIFFYISCLKKNGPRYDFAIEDPNEKIIQE